ncbi:MAG: OmpA family protein [Pseudomonadota bacterium]
MKLLRSLVVVGAVASLTACSAQLHKFDEEKALENATPIGNAFTQRLTSEYQNFVASELDGFDDEADSLHFSRKGLAAAKGDMVSPEQVSDWQLLPGHAEELIVARSRLINVYDMGAREIQPDLSAVAQVRYDCWIENQEENFQQNEINACKSQFMDALAQLEAMAPPAPPPAPEPEVFDVDPNEPMAVENAKYIVFFDFDKHNINVGAAAILDAAADEIKKRNLNAVRIVGHTDTSGSQSYNTSLSQKRAQAVVDGLVARGIDASLMTSDYRGENELLVETADGVREPANRRGEITFE